MIIKGRARGRSRELAQHLLRSDQNEDIRLYELRGVTATDVEGALAEMEALSALVPGKRPLYHASISPEAHTPLTPGQVCMAADTLERELGLGGQPRVILVHRKKDREHVHVVWSRIDVERQRLISDAWNYRAHEAAARALESAFGHRTIQGVHVPANHAPRKRYIRDYEYRQAERGQSPQQVSAALAALWRDAPDQAAFRKSLAAAGFRLARGDRRVFVIIDQAGNVHSLSRRLGIPAAELRSRMKGINLEALPPVEEVRKTLQQATDRKEEAAAFRAAAEVFTQPARHRPRRFVPGMARETACRAAVAWINEPLHREAPAARIVPQRLLTAARLGALRAAILADFAAKMDDAARRLGDDALLAALARLADERDAALHALGRMNLKTRAGAARVTRRRRPRRRYALRRRPLRNRKGVN